MELKKVWMSPETEKKSRYGYRAVGGVLGIVLLMTVLLLAGTMLSLSMGVPQKWFSSYPYSRCHCDWDCIGCTDGTARDAGCHDFLSYRK